MARHDARAARGRAGGGKAGREEAAAGLAALTAGAYAEAVFHLEAAVRAAPRDARLRTALARAHAGNGAPAEAIDRASEALGLDPRSHDAARLASSLLLQYELTDHAGLDPRGLRAAMAFDDVDRAPLARTALAFLRERTPLGDLLAQGAEGGAQAGWPAAADTLLADPREQLGGPAGDPLFHAALAAAPLADAETEFLLTAARARLLDAGRDAPLDKARAGLACTLIAQGLLNEYVWAVGDAERDALAGLAIDAQALASGDADSIANVSRALLLGALYAPPEHLLDPATDPKALAALRPRALRDLVTERFAALREEAALAEGIESLGEPDDAVSQAVRDQYEDNPYPRWTSTLVPRPGTLHEALAGFFTAEELAPFDRPIDVLVAGCGTGEQLVHAARGYGDAAQIDGIDLSRASLAYARRMCGQLGIENVALRQGDILALAGTEKRYDVIESVGVLHHMSDPFAGWRILIDVLRPRGLMYTGLYSAVARAQIQALREKLRSEGLGEEVDTIRAVRRRMMDAPEGSDARALARSADFNTLSNVRDLLFHRHEAPVTIAQIRDFLEARGLAFHGFDVRPHIAEAFARHFGADADPRDLSQWSAFEAEHPATFDGMYLFWCRKPAKTRRDR